MKTGHKTPCRQGDVIDVRSPVSGRPYHEHGVIVTDPAAQGKVAGIGGYDCRPATAQERAQAEKEGRVRTEYL
jgi:hypothetical protein